MIAASCITFTTAVTFAAGGLPNVSASPAVPAAQPWHNQAYAGDPAGFRPDRVPTAVTLDDQSDSATITYTMATFPVANGAAPTQAQIDSVPAPDKMSAVYNGPIPVVITATQAVVIKAYAYTAGVGADDSAITTWVGFQRVWVLSDVKTLQDGSPNDFRAKVPTAWTESVLDKVIGEMTDNEKYPMLGGGQNGQIANSMPNPKNPTAAAGSNMSDVRLNSSATGVDMGISRLCIPTTIMSDGPAGVRNSKNATAWVVATALASAWDPDVQRMFAQGVANDAKWFGYDFMLAPAFDIHRSPLGGRNFEYYSEDPYITGVNATMYTKTLQDGVDRFGNSYKVGVSLKHYVANDQENNRNNLNAVVSERTLREINLRPFEMAVAGADPYVMMTSYNPMNGPHTTMNPWLQSSLPYDQWGYRGFYQTDWGNQWNAYAIVARCDQHQSTASASVVTPYLTTENNTTGGPAITPATYAARTAIVNRDIKDILHSVIKMPVFSGDYDGLSDATTAARHTAYYTDSTSPRQENAALNRELAAKTFILLRNNNVNGVPVLPLVGDNKKSISLVYSTSVPNNTQGFTDFVVQGGGSGAVTFDKNQTGGKTIHDALIAEGYSVPNYMTENDTRICTATGTKPNQVVTNLNTDAINAFASGTDVGIMIISRTSSEGSDPNPPAFDLYAPEIAVMNAMSAAFHAAGKPFVVITNLGGNVNTTQIRADADAILHISAAGEQGGWATADVLSGAVNPSGKTVDTWPLTFNDTVPMLAYNTYKDKIDPSHLGYTWSDTNTGTMKTVAFYDEGNLVGYRFFDTMEQLDPNFKASDHVAFPFGFGLSYATFAYSNLKLSNNTFNNMDDNTTVDATVTVTNTSASVSGRTAVEMYIGASTFKEEGRPYKELKDYAMTKVLAPGESQNISFKIDKRDLCYFDDGKNNDNWVWNVKMAAGTAVNRGVDATSNAQYAAMNNVAPNVPADLQSMEPSGGAYVKQSLNGVQAYTTYNGFYGENGHTSGWRVDPGTEFTVWIGPDSSTADLLAYGTKSDLEYGPLAAISAPAIVDTDKEQFVYTVSAKELSATTMIEIKAQFDASKLDAVGSALQPAVKGWSVLRENYDPATGLYDVVLSAMGGTPLNAANLTDILKVTFNPKAGVQLKLTDVVGAKLLAVDVYEKASVTNIKVAALLDPDSASSAVTNHLRWDVSDGMNGGPDGFLGLEDLDYIITNYYGARVGDANWNVAKNFDTNGDGVVNLVDIMNIMSYIK